MENLGKTGARKGKRTVVRRWISRLAAPLLIVFPVPGEDFFRSRGIFLHNYFDIASNPREANVLLVAGELTEKMAMKTAVVYLQMPRPRALVFAGTEPTGSLPVPDIMIALSNEQIQELKPRLSYLFETAWRNDAEAFQPNFIKKMMKENEEGDQEHHHGKESGKQEKTHQHNESDTHSEGEEHEHQEKGDSHQKHHQKNASGNIPQQDHAEHDDHKADEHHKQANGKHHQNGHKHENHGHGGHNHQGGSMGFMSMVEMTKHLPRASDGLPMERNKAWFGPFFPGLPGGLAFNFTLDGDTVIEIKAEKELFNHEISCPEQLTSEDFLQEVVRFTTPASSVYRILGEQIVKKSAGSNPELNRQQIISIEKARVENHLNGLSAFGILIGNQWLTKTAVRHLQIFQQEVSFSGVRDFSRKVLHFKLLQNKLQHAGKIPGVLLHHASGPVARAAGMEKDLRISEPGYRRLGFTPIVLDENNAWGRLKIRLLEIEQSLDLLQKLTQETGKNQPEEKKSFGKQAFYMLEGPAGVIHGELQTDQSRFKRLKLCEASAIHVLLAEQMIKEMELSDALITLASLDLNPCALATKYITQKNN